jgi:hypothetical protein
MPDFSDNFGIIGFGDGAVVLPGPTVEADWNISLRDYEDRTFRWGMVVGIEPSPDLGYQQVEATHYRLEITPDLGWSNLEAMFEANIQGNTLNGNSKLLIIDRLSLASDLTNIGDGTVSYAVPLDSMKKILAPGYSRYLWRVRGITTSGQIGDPSIVQYFKGRVLVASTEWTIDTPERVSRFPTASIKGKKTSAITSIEINGVTTWSTYPSDTTWAADVPLAPGTNILTIRATDSKGNTSEYRTIEVELTNKDLTVHPYWNTFDEFGYLVDLGRIPGENNASYRDRITDVFLHRAGPRYGQLINALNRELDLEYADQAVLIQAAQGPSDRRHPDVRVWLTADAFFVHTPRMVKRQVYTEIDAHSRSIAVDDARVFGKLVIEQPIGLAIPEKDYSFKDNEIRFKDAKYCSAPVYLTYEYVEKVAIGTKTVQQLVNELNALTYNGVSLVVASLGSGFDGTKSATGLVRFPQTLLTEGEYLDAGNTPVIGQLPIRWSQARLYAFMDKRFKSQFLNVHGSYFGTKYESWALRMKAFMHTTWGLLVADENLWSDTQVRVSGIGVLDTMYDAFRGAWISGSTGVFYPTYLAVRLGFKDPVDGSSLIYIGILPSWFHSGVGDGDDLYVMLPGSDDDEEFDYDMQPSTVTNSSDGTEDNADLGFGTTLVDSSSEVS